MPTAVTDAVWQLNEHLLSYSLPITHVTHYALNAVFDRYGEEGSFIGQYRENKELPNFRPRTQQQPDPYSSSRPPAQPVPRARGPPSESAYVSYCMILYY